MTPAQNITNGAMAHGAWQKPYELEQLVERVLDLEPLVTVEIGSALGGTFYAWCQCAPETATVISIDLGEKQTNLPYATTNALQVHRKAGQMVECIRGDSQDEATRDELVELLGGSPIDFLFIDADHRLAGVSRDHELYEPLVRKGGLIAFHDILPQPRDERGEEWVIDVAPLWERVKGPRSWEFIDYSVSHYGGIGVYEKQ